MTGFIFFLPKAVLREIITSWLNLPQIAKLDSALCDTGCRPVFEQTLRCGHYCCDHWNSCQSNNHFVSWVIKRNVRLQSAVLDNTLVENSSLRYAFLRTTGKELRAIDVVSEAQPSNNIDAAYLDVSMFCCELRECTLSSNNNDFAINALLGRNPHIERVTLSGSPELIGAICHLLPSATDVTIRTHVQDTALKRFIEARPQKLTRLRIVGWDCHQPHMLEQLVHCNTLLELRIGYVDPHVWRDKLIAFPRLEVFRCKMHTCVSRLNVLLTSMPNLQTLIIAKPVQATSSTVFVVESEMLHIILDKLVHLRQFVAVAECEGLLRPHPLPPITFSEGSGAGMCVLEELYITTSGIYTHPSHYYSMDAVFERCPRLRLFGVSTPPTASAQDTDGTAFFRASANAHAKRLVIAQSSLTIQQIPLVRGYKELSLLDCCSLGDQNFATLARNNHLLRVLQVKKAGSRSLNGSHLTHHALLTFLEQCPLLHSIEFVYQDNHAQKAHLTTNQCSSSCCENFTHTLTTLPAMSFEFQQLSSEVYRTFSNFYRTSPPSSDNRCVLRLLLLL